MGEFPGYSKSEEEQLKEFTKLTEAMDKAEDKFEEGEDTSAEQLDRYLSAAATFYKWQAHNPHPDHPPEERERSAEWHLRYQRVLNGSYQMHKADYALERASSEK